jgi:nucleoside-diphosphate-sugar epimerase
MKVLVIGAAGKSGRAVVEQALAAGHDVTAFVDKTEGSFVKRENAVLRAAAASLTTRRIAALSGFIGLLLEFQQ